MADNLSQNSKVRFATFNASLNRNSTGELISDLSTPNNDQAKAVAEIIQRTNPDVLLLNEFDYDDNGIAIANFQQNYLEVSQNGVDAVEYPYVYLAPSNTGIPSGFDFDNNGSVGGGNDAFGFGSFPGQFGMVLLSKYPIVENEVRTFQNFLWKDMPNALLPDDSATVEPNDWYSPEELEVFRLSSKSHWDIPVNVNGEIIHVLASHPTPPVFDGAEDRNGKRNHDEIRFWADYVTPGEGDYIYDDTGNTGGLNSNAKFVIMGDQNADPNDGDSTNNAILQLLDNPQINTNVTPSSEGGVDATSRQGGANLNHTGNPAFDTADFADNTPGNLRADYVLPSQNLKIQDAKVFWTTAQDPLFNRLIGDFPFPSSDHRLVYTDINLSSVEMTNQNRQSVTKLSFLGETSFPTGLDFSGTEVGGLSGIGYDASKGVYYAIADDRSSNARFYTLNIDLSDGKLNKGDIIFNGVTTLQNASGNAFANNSLDPEGIALTDSGNLFIASEGDTNNLINPFINEFSLQGRQLSELPIPEKFLPTANQSGGIRNNLAFESLTITPNQRYLYTATENALFQDGAAADVEQESLSRIIKYDLTTGQPVAEFVYEVDQVAVAPDSDNAFRTNGLVELLAIDNNGTLLALERSFTLGKGNTVKLYEVQTQGALDVSSQDDLFREEALEDDGDIIPPGAFEIDPAVQKRLLVDFADLGITPDNLEGLALGPTLPSGSQSLIVVSDNNFSNTQTTQFIALALDFKTTPAVLPTVETPYTIDNEEVPVDVLAGDSDDPAIWVNPDNPGESIVIGTLKDGGLVTFNLQGEIQQTISPLVFGEQRFNNVDIIYNFPLASRIVSEEPKIDLAVVSDRANDTLAIYSISENGQLEKLSTPQLDDPAFSIFGVDDGEATAYGLATYTSPVSGKSYVFVTQADGNKVAQIELTSKLGPADEQLIEAEVVRTLELPIPEGGEAADSQSEGLVVDQELGFLYVAIEGADVLKFAAEPETGNNFTVVQASQEQAELEQVPFSDFIAFGDSTTDVGNIFLSTGGTFPASPPYFNGRLSNGLLVPEILAEEIGLSASTPFLGGGTNYAFGGAELGAGDGGEPSVGEQINFYLGADAPTATDLFFISAGSNSIVPDLDATPAEIIENIPEIEDIVADLTGHITTLANAGAENFIISNLPSFGDTPLITSQGVSNQVNSAVIEFNNLLDTELDQLEDELGINITELDVASEIAKIRANPSQFGFTNTDTPAFNSTTGAVVPNPNEYFWWDDFHPTATVYSLIAQGLIDDIPQATTQFAATNVSPLIPDIEGLSIYYGDNGTGYLIANSQGDSSYAVFSREGNNEYLSSFIVGDHNGIDQVNESDGLDITNVALGSEFPNGLLVLQDGANDPQFVVENDEELENISTNFKFVPLENIEGFNFDSNFDPRNPQPQSLINGIASGDTTQNSTVLWARSTFKGEITFEYSTDESFNSVIGTVTQNVENINVPVKVEIEGLTPGTQYYYRVTDAAGASGIGKLKTSAQTGDYQGFRFGATGDWQQAPPYPSLKNADDRDLELFIKLGDTIYADLETPALPGVSQARSLSDFRTKQAEVLTTRFNLNTVPELYASTSILATIDDHEIVDNFAGGAAPGDSPDAPDIGSSTEPLFTDDVEFVNDTQVYEDALQAYQEYHPLQNNFYGETGDNRTANERKLYRYNTYGSDAAVIMLDSRSFRDDQINPVNLTNPQDAARFLAEASDPTRTLLGRQQVADLKADLLDAEQKGITWKFITIPEPIQNFGLLNAEDRFEGYAAERTEILKFIDDNDIDNVVFMAGDFHGTIVNNLTYQTAPGTEQIATNAFEIVTGPAAFNDGLFGPTVANIATAAGLITQEQRAFYDGLPVATDADNELNDKDDFIKQLLVQQTTPLGYDPVGLNNNLSQAENSIDAQLLQGDYVSTHKFGWTEFDIDQETQALTVTTYGIEPYSEAELLANPQSITGREPQIVSQFVVNPQTVDSLNINPIDTTNKDANGNEIELIDLTPFTGRTVTASFEINREADYNNNVYFYTVDNVNGEIGSLAPNASGYLQAALNNVINPTDGLTTPDEQPTTGTLEIVGGNILGIVIIADGTLEQAQNNINSVEGVYFSYLGANTDNGSFDHIKFEDNMFKFEDLANGGDRDFNDIEININFTV
ncbi:phytase [Plectonema cf. radiosum LEGE 06105]|uniref:Phytase n=1 Tax=Plectonema cf. radiosum LEGE 06105 TaxID=945769 RepID=A0A8J7EZG9_9CYAN|nr:phytase [Plectonema radiosum]MBE9212788.1 phytase [Plectonema cf. radiosum LEGE 06105]